MVQHGLGEFHPSTTESQTFLYIVLIVTVVDSPEYWEMACTGTLLRPNIVLTTASCLMEYDLIPDPLNTKIYERPSGIERRAFKIYIHPRNCMPGTDPDYPCFNFAIIEIESTSQTVFPTLPRRDQLLERRSSGCLMGSYGGRDTLCLNAFRTIDLDKTKWSVVKCRLPRDQCSLGIHFHFYIPCRDDVGTPLICNGTLMAIYSPKIYPTNVNCLDTYISYFTQVSSSLDWVESIVNAPTGTFNWLNNSGYCLVLFIVVMASVSAIYLGVIEIIQWGSDLRESMDQYTSKASNMSVSRTTGEVELFTDVVETSSVMLNSDLSSVHDSSSLKN